MQTEAAGKTSPVDKLTVLRCLAQVAHRHGVDVSVETLSRRFGSVPAKLTPELITSIAADVGLNARAMKLRWRDLPGLKRLLPAILPLTDGTAVILDAVEEHPSAGLIANLITPGPDGDSRILVNESQLRDVWNGDAFLLKRRQKSADDHGPFDLHWLASQVLRERGLFRDISLASLFATTFALVPPFIAMIVIDRVIVNHSTATLWVVAGALALMVVFEMLLTFLRRLFMEVTATRIDGRLNIYVMDRLLRLPMDYFERTPTGYTLGRLGQIYRIRTFLTGQLFGAFLDMITLVGLVPALLFLNWHLALFVFACAGAIFVLVYYFMGPLERRHGEIVRTEREKNAFLTESVYGMRTVKSLALEDRRRGEWDAKVADNMQARYRWGVLANYPQTFVIPFNRAMYSGSIVIGAALALANPGVNPGAIIAFSMLAGRTAQPLVQLAQLLSDFGDVRAAIAEVAAVMNVPPEDLRAGTGLRQPVRGQIAFEGVDFRYSPGAPKALSDVSFTIEPGAIFGVMGRSGSGKTTITRLLQGLSPDYEGIIKVDGMDLREMDIQHLRASIGVVPQENFLFSGSVRDNISIARPHASMAEVVKAAQLAGAEEFIERMPKGYETRLEEGATNLSGGQRQRLALARALLLDPPVLILDEATSSLDPESEAIINNNLARIANDRTVICVSHRLSMLTPASAILVMERGGVYDIGRHEDLLLRCDIYKLMWHQQNRHLTPPANAPYIVATR